MWLHPRSLVLFATVGLASQLPLVWSSDKGALAVQPHGHCPSATSNSTLCGRIKETNGWCEQKARGYTGYIDLGANKHMFFYFFESRHQPDKDPLMLWVDGGPGCSAALGLLYHIGPCRIADNGTTTTNPYSFNNRANLIVLDQPVSVGFSYGDNGEMRDTSDGAAEDAMAFLQGFVKRFPKFRGRDFHFAGHSYGGRFAPVFGAALLDLGKRAPVHLKSVIMANGIADFETAVLSYYDIQCTNISIPPVQTIEECTKIKAAVPVCEERIQSSCVKVFDGPACRDAYAWCTEKLVAPLEEGTDLNPYDISQKCTDPDAFCYPGFRPIIAFLNSNETRKQLGVDPAVGQVDLCHWPIVNAFADSFDVLRTSKPQVASLLERGVRVLNYAGNLDAVCTWIGNLRWMQALAWSGHDAFAARPLRPWIVDGARAGVTKSAKGFTFVNIEGAGHLAAHDKPQQTYTMMHRWLKGKAI